MTAHWHDVNPWRDSVVYVPLERLAACAAGGLVREVDGSVVPYDADWILRHWRRCGGQLDAYILPQPSGVHSIGVRYGADGPEYLSPHNENPDLTNALLAEYGG